MGERLASQGSTAHRMERWSAHPGKSSPPGGIAGTFQQGGARQQRCRK